MKKLIALILIAAMLVICCTGCKKNKAPSDDESPARESGGLTQALENAENSGTVVEDGYADDNGSSAEYSESGEIAEPTADSTTENTDSASSGNKSGDIMPFATDAPQPHASINSFTELSGTGLGFRFNYPTGWTNLPGRSTVCYLQPIGDGTEYPARVAITMKRLYHPCDSDEMMTQLYSYLTFLQQEFNNGIKDNNRRFKVAATNTAMIDTSVRFMGKPSIGTTYVAYDGEQEIKGYVVMTHFERYVYAFHFLCAYADYDSFYPSMCTMRDSVQVEETKK